MAPLPQEVLLDGLFHPHLDDHLFLRLLQTFQGLQHRLHERQEEDLLHLLLEPADHRLLLLQRLLGQHQDYLTGRRLNNQHEAHSCLLLLPMDRRRPLSLLPHPTGLDLHLRPLQPHHLHSLEQAADPDLDLHLNDL